MRLCCFKYEQKDKKPESSKALRQADIVCFYVLPVEKAHKLIEVCRPVLGDNAGAVGQHACFFCTLQAFQGILKYSAFLRLYAQSAGCQQEYFAVLLAASAGFVGGAKGFKHVQNTEMFKAGPVQVFRQCRGHGQLYACGFQEGQIFPCTILQGHMSGIFFLGKRVIYNDGHPIDGIFGDHPWADVSTIDWATLPSSYADAQSRMAQDDWAVVNNPNREDRLHLRVSPDKDAASLGKYYNRTPVCIREYGEDWCAVTVCGVDGWMMTQYLAFGADMNTVEYAGPRLSLKAELTEFHLYAKPRSTSDYTVHPIPGHWPDFYVMGVAGDYYHIWLPYTEEYGYIHMDDLWEGNG